MDAEASAEEAAWGLTRRHIGGAPARDEGNLVGVLSSSDLVNPEPAQWIRGEATVGDLMNPDVISLYADDPAMAAVNEMARRDIHRIIVLDQDSKLAGIVTPSPSPSGRRRRTAGRRCRRDRPGCRGRAGERRRWWPRLRPRR